MIFYTTNLGFFFARNVTVSMSYYVLQIQRVVLAFDARSLAGVLTVGTSMEAWKILRILGCEIDLWTFSHPRLGINITHPSIITL